MCGLAGDPPYIWFRNGQNVGQRVNYWAYIQSGDSYSCAFEGYERLRSPLVCKSLHMIPGIILPFGCELHVIFHEWIQTAGFFLN